MSVAQRLDPFVHGTSLALVAYLPYRPVIALARRIAADTGSPHPATAATRRPVRLVTVRDDWDAEGALADLQRPLLGR
jgi:hypothetical protein